MLDRIYLDEPAGRLAEAHWKLLLVSRGWREAGRLAGEFRRPPAASESPTAAQFIDRVAMLAQETRAITTGEREINEILFVLYGLTQDEQLLVESRKR